MSHAKKGIELVSRLPEGAARQYQDLGLQIVRGQALTTTRGYGAQETLEAFLRARELCVQIGRPPHLVPVIYGLWGSPDSLMNSTLGRNSRKRCDGSARRKTTRL